MRNTFVLVSVFEDENSIIPVKLEIKEFKDKDNSLYLSVVVNNKEEDNTVQDPVENQQLLEPSSTSYINIPQLLKKSILLREIFLNISLMKY